MTNRSNRLLDLADVYVLWSFAVAQPIYSLLTANPGFFVARQSEPVDFLAFLFALSLGLPLLLFLVEELIGLLTARGRKLFHFLLLAALAEATLFPWVKEIRGIKGVFLLISVTLLVIAGAWAYFRFRTQHRSLVFLSPAVLLFPVLFVLSPPIKGQILRRGHSSVDLQSQAKNPVPIVMVVFDEFPLTSLLNDKLEINPLLYPNFADLAKSATWYRNATAVSEGTFEAIPAILNGLYPPTDRSLLPNASDHPHSLFTLLGGSYRLNVVENCTQLCPEELCRENRQPRSPLAARIYGIFSDLEVLYLYLVLPNNLTERLPDISHSWKNFKSPKRQPTVQGTARKDYEYDWSDRQDRFIEFVRSIQPASKPVLHFLHSMLPHSPWEYLPSGQKYTLWERHVRGLRHYKWTTDERVVLKNYQRHLLQVGAVDRLLGLLVDHLKKTGLYDRTLLIILADHGRSFIPGDYDRNLAATNYAGIISIPLFIKQPSQKCGTLDDRNVQLVDILPTIADILELKIPWKVDGRSALQPGIQPPTEKLAFTNNRERRVFDSRSVMDRKREIVMQKLRHFGDGRNTDEIFKFGPHSELVGLTKSEINMAGRISGSYEIDGAAYFEKVDLAAPFLMAGLTGRVFRSHLEGSDRSLELAVVVNGTIKAVTETLESGQEEEFSVLVPPSTFRNGHNEVSILVVSGSTAQPILREFDNVTAPKYRWGDSILFGVNGNARSYELEGWSLPDGRITWTDGRSATLALPTPVPTQPVTLRAKFGAFVVPGKVPRQTVRILINQRHVGEWNIDNRDFRTRTLAIPNACFADPQRTLVTFELPNATSPSKIGVSKDARELGIAVMSISLSYSGIDN